MTLLNIPVTSSCNVDFSEHTEKTVRKMMTKMWTPIISIVAQGKPTLSNKIPARVGPINAPKSKLIY